MAAFTLCQRYCLLSLALYQTRTCVPTCLWTTCIQLPSRINKAHAGVLVNILPQALYYLSIYLVFFVYLHIYILFVGNKIQIRSNVFCEVLVVPRETG